MKSTSQKDELTEVWSLPSAARLGSSVRSQGIYLEVRAQLPPAAKKALTVKAGELTLRMPAREMREFSKASAVISSALEGIESLPVIPREIEDILGISSTERHRWLKDGRLHSAGTRTVNLRGRARSITFHIFDPRMVEDLLDRHVVDRWREEDAEAAAERRRRGSRKAPLTTGAGDALPRQRRSKDDGRFKLKGWAAFERDGPLR